MIKNLALLLIGILVSSSFLLCQSESFDCSASENNALCDLGEIDGYMFSNPPFGSIPAPGGALCGGGAFHNPGWFSFVAGSESIALIVTPITCDTVAGGQTGVQIALWEGCPGLDGECVGGTDECFDTPYELIADDLVIGEVYNLVIDGCAGSVCEVEVGIISASEFELPDLDEDFLDEPKYDIRGSCDNELPENSFCAGIPVRFRLDQEFYDELGAEWYWEFTGPDAGSIEWEFGTDAGTGSQAQIGDLNGELGANGVNVTFPTTGTYEVCLNNVETECDSDADGPVCWEIDIITPGFQEFDSYEVCIIDLLTGWDPADEDIVNGDGAEWRAGEIFLSDVEDGDGMVEKIIEDDCGCDFTQTIEIVVQGSLDRPEVELFVFECMLPYEWYDEEFEDPDDLPENDDILLSEGSMQFDAFGNQCDSLIDLTVTLLTGIDTVIVGDCTADGTEFTFELIARDSRGDEVIIDDPNVIWLDASTGLEVANTETAILETGTYLINYQSFIQDLNYMEDDMSGILEFSECEMQFGPYDLVGGNSVDPDINPYDQVYCDDELEMISFSIDTVPDTEYAWIIPPSYDTLFISKDSLAISINTYVPTDTLFVTASNACGSSDSIPLPIMVVTGPMASSDGEETVCDGEEYLTAYDGDPAMIQMYAWNTPGGSITTGDANTQSIGITYPMPGSYQYSLTVTDMDGCTSSETFDVTVEQNLEAPAVDCDGDPSQIIFTWQDIPGATDYDITEIDIPTGASGMRMGNSYVVTGVNGGDMATIIVTAIGGTDCVVEGEEVSCEAPGCNFTGVVNNNFMDMSFCQGDPENMEIQFDIEIPANFTGTYTGNGISPDGLFDPNSSELVLGVNILEFSYGDDTGCTDVIGANVVLSETPDASFTPASTNICVGETIELTGADPAGVYSYGQGAEGDFSGLSYRTSGDKTITVTLTDPVSGCSDDFEAMVTVIDTVPAPLISCVPGTSTVDFDWDDHPLADEYEVTIIVNNGTPQVFMQSNSDFSQTGLAEGDRVDITVSVTANNGCNTAATSDFCEARACLEPVVELTAVREEFCINGDLNPVTIDVVVDGMPADDSTIEWIGSGVDMNGTFDPALVNPGITRVTARYTSPIDNCVTSESIDFTLYETPVPEYSVSTENLCVDDVLLLTLENVPAGLLPEIETDGGVDNTLAPGELEIAWDTPGTYTISVGYTVQDCAEERVSTVITVRDTVRSPNVNCTNVGTDFIEFGWQDQNAVSEYEVYIDGMLESTQTESEYLLEDLDPEQTVEIRVVALDPECGNKEGMQLCRSQECVPPTWTADVPDAICYETGSGPVVLDVTAQSGGMGTGTIEWTSPEVDNNGNFSPGDQSQDYTLTAVYTERNCSFDTSFNIRVNIVPEALLELTSDDVICVGGTVTVQSNYNASAGETPEWDFGGATFTGTDFGPYDVSFDTPGTYTIGLFVDNNGCLGSQETVTVTVEEELIAPEVMCSSNDINEINLSWNNVDCAAEYRVLVDGIEATRTTDTNYTITGLIENQEVEVAVEAISECACDNVMSQPFFCETKACIAPTWNINVTSPVCWEPSMGSILLDVTAESNDPALNGTLSWPSPLVDDQGNFSPEATSQDYSFTVVYEEGECRFEETVDIRVNVIPEAQLELTTEQVICEGSSVRVVSNYNPDGNESPEWDFGGGVATGTGFGPYDVEFDTPGNYTISLFVDNEGCEGDVETVQVEVQEELTTPVVDCNSDDINSIELNWDMVDCASEYTIFVNGLLDGSTSSTNYTIQGLNENEEVEVRIEAISQCACDNVQSQLVSCSSKPCDPTSWTFSGNTLMEVCLDSNAEPFTISATPEDLPGNGSGSWTGPAISDPDGTVDPNLVDPGTYEFIYTYSEGGCDYTAPAVEISFVEEPELTLEAMDPACPMDNSGTITAIGMGGDGTYNYILDGGAVQQSGVFTDVSIGNHTVEIIDGNNCINTASIDIFAPLTPDVNIIGPSTVISDNDASFELDISNAGDIEDIIWTSGGEILCQGINCTTLNLSNVLADFEIVAEVVYNGGCMAISEPFLVDVREIQAYYIPNIVNLGGAPDENSRWTIFIKGNETFPKSIKVYTRWGNLIYDDAFNITAPTDEVELWNGFSGDNPVDAGVYTYALEIEIEGRTEFIVGDITILR